MCDMILCMVKVVTQFLYNFYMLCMCGCGRCPNEVEMNIEKFISLTSGSFLKYVGWNLSKNNMISRTVLERLRRER